MSRSIAIDWASVVVVAAVAAAIGIISAPSGSPLFSLGTPAATAQPSDDQSSPLGRRVIAAMKSRGYEIDPVFNIVAISGMNPDGTRNDNHPDQWNDLVLIVKPDGTVLHIAQATTEPAWGITQKPIVPPGAAQLAFGQHPRAYQIGIHQGSSHHEALVQTGGPVTILRDVNRNGRRDADDLRVSGFFGINWHRATTTPLKTIQGYSAGCIVTNDITKHLSFMRILKTHPGYQRDRLFRFTVTLLNGADT